LGRIDWLFRTRRRTPSRPPTLLTVLTQTPRQLQLECVGGAHHPVRDRTQARKRTGFLLQMNRPLCKTVSWARSAICNPRRPQQAGQGEHLPRRTGSQPATRSRLHLSSGYPRCPPRTMLVPRSAAMLRDLQALALRARLERPAVRTATSPRASTRANSRLTRRAGIATAITFAMSPSSLASSVVASHPTHPS